MTKHTKTTHRFILDVTGPVDREHAERAVLFAFAMRNPDGCEFELHSKMPRRSLKALTKTKMLRIAI